jgi:hypothetical protein
MSTSESESDVGRESRAGTRCHYDVLDLAPGATASEIADAHRRSVALVDGSALGGYAMLDPESARLAREEIDDARRVLLDATLRDAYDTTRGYPPARANGERQGSRTDSAPVTSKLTPPTGRTSSLPSLRILSPIVVEEESPPLSRETEPISNDATTVGQVVAATPTVVDAESDATVPPVVSASSLADVETKAAIVDEASFDGPAIRRMRESRGVTLESLAGETHIRRNFLVAIEEMTWGDLPERVFVRGFLTQIARVLRVDAKTLVEGYLAHDPRRRAT